MLFTRPIRISLSLAFLAPAQGYLVPPPGTAAPGTTDECSEWLQYSSALTCAWIEQLFGMTEAQFAEWNPIVTEVGGSDTCGLFPGLYYCVQVNFSTISVASTNPLATTSSSSAPATSLPASATPTPVEPGIVDQCTTFYLVVSGDTCAAIAAEAGITISDFEIWNPSVGTDCAGLWLGYYVCIGTSSSSSALSSVSTTTPSTITATSTGNGVTTPTPYEPGMVDNCTTFYLVVSGDGCAAIANAAGVTLANFYAWNPSVGSDCAGLWLGYYVCVGV